jgi:predicted MFS family arabinose efflux permease
MVHESKQKQRIFSRYEVFVIAVLTFLQFTIVLDFMVLSPLGAQLLDELNITTAQFGWVVSAYAFSAGTSGLLTAGFADKFDRKKLLLFFYTGFIGGTLLCALAPDYHSLLVARIVTGLFGGVIGSISFAIITDIFRMEVRGRVMGFVQMAFATTQVLGIPIGLFLANRLGWHSPFYMIVCLGVLVGIAIAIHFRPIDAHLKIQSDRSPFQHLIKTMSHPMYIRAFAATTLLATGGYMMMPFGSAFSIHNLGISFDDLPMLYLITGICSMITGPFIGKLSDTIGKYVIFFGGTLISMFIVVIYCNLGLTPLWLVVVMNVVMFVGISSRIISSSALMTAVPEPMDRGAFMSINASVQQISGGIASVVAGMIVVQTETGKILHYDTLGYVVVGAMIITVIMMYFINEQVMRKPTFMAGVK